MKTTFRLRLRCLWIAIASIAVSFRAGAGEGEELRIGLIGLDTSHVIAFTQLLNDSERADHIPGGRVVAAYKGGSPDIHASWSRLDGFTDRLRDEFGVQIMDTIEKLCENVDAVMLTSVDGRPHLEQARPVIEAGLPLFIDKPVAGSLADAIEIFRLAEARGVPVFSSSSLRFYESLTDLMEKDVGEIHGAISIGPARIEPTHPDLFWYGIHAVEAMYAVLGKGCETVVRTFTENTDVVTGVWSDGRVGTFRGIRNARVPFRVTVFGSDGIADQEGRGNYAPMLREIVTFFQNGVAPVAPEETIELFAFMEAADESRRRGGKPVRIDETIAKAEAAEQVLPRVRPEEAGIDGERLAATVEELIAERIESRVFPGAAVIVGRNGKVAYERAFGNLSYDDGSSPVELGTMFDLASLTKVVGTTTACMVLVDRGLMNLDDPVAAHLPEFTHEGVTVRHLLLHEGGFPSWRPFFREAESPAEVMDLIFQTKLEREPGERMLYSDMGMILLGRVVEAISGRPLDEFLREEVYRPLGMHRTLFNPPGAFADAIPPTELDANFRERLVQGVVHDENAYALGGVAGHAGLFATGQDLARFGQTMLNEGTLGGNRIVRSETVRLFVERQGQGNRALGWGMRPAGRSAENDFSQSAYGHTGFTGTSIWIDPEKDLFVVFLTNRVHPTRDRGGIGSARSALYEAVLTSLRK